MSAESSPPLDEVVTADNIRRWRAEQRERYGDNEYGELLADERPTVAYIGPRTLNELAQRLAERRLRPVIDHDLHLVRAECVDCYAGASDPSGLWRPASYIPRNDRLSVVCDACGTWAVVR